MTQSGSKMSRWSSAFVLGALLLLALETGSVAQQSERSRGVRSQNNQVLQLLAQLQENPGNPGVREQAAELLEARIAVLAALIEQDPSEAVRLAFPTDVLSDLASAFPAARRQLEAHGTWEGPIEYIVEDSADFRTHRNIRAMTTGGETLFIQFAGIEPDGLKSGDTLRVSGIRAGNQIAALNGATTQAAGGRPPKPTPVPCTTVGVQKTIVLMVTMPDAPIPPELNKSLQESIFFDTSRNVMSLTDYWRENSYGATTAEGVVAPGDNGDGWYTLDQAYSDEQTNEIRAAAMQAADPDVDFTQYTRLFLVINGMPMTQNYAGRGTLACSTFSSADGTFNMSTSWLRGSAMNEQTKGAFVAIHEGGHNLGLHHANARDFDTEVLGAPGTAGVLTEYGDIFSEMGRGRTHYAAPHKARLGWLPSQVVTVTSSGGYAVQPIEDNGSLLALKIRRGTDDTQWVWVEYRQPLHIYDERMIPPHLAWGNVPYLDAAISRIYTGGLVHYEDATTGRYTHLLDFTPGSITTVSSPHVADDWLDPPLVGSWTDPYSGLTLTTSNPTPGALTVDVIYGSGPCVASNPSVAIAPANVSTKRGQSVTYTVTVTNNDTLPCSSRSFDLSSSLPDGWSTTLSQTSVTVGAGSSAAVAMTKTVPTNAAYATYTVDASATSGTHSGVGTASVTVKPGK